MTQLALIDDVANPTDIALAEHAAVIKALGKRVVGDVIEIGARLTECKRIAGHGNWLPWLDREFGWSEDTAENYMRLADFDKFRTVRNLDLDMRSLYLITKQSTPDTARDAVLDLAANGEKLTHAKVKEMIAEAKDTTAADYEVRIAKLTKRYEDKLEQLRSDLGEAPEALQEAINDQLAPLLAKIKRLEDERDKRHDEAPKRKDQYGTQTAAINNALRSFAATLTISADQVIEHQTIVADATGRALSETMAEMQANARTAQAWLVQLTREDKS
jgi:Protein of unknown function (DUF3102)